MAADNWARRVIEEKGPSCGILASANTTGSHVQIHYEFGPAALAFVISYPPPSTILLQGTHISFSIISGSF
ncbi:hypothetical protein NC651_014068 [Populus alba x Populus x berolinensis]|nr:hypothetical protein NC651_014068 [Populus alba x Populus x berolinensis]